MFTFLLPPSATSPTLEVQQFPLPPHDGRLSLGGWQLASFMMFCFAGTVKLKPEVGARHAVSPPVCGVGGRRDLTRIYCVGSQAVASGPPVSSSVDSNKLRLFQLQ